MSKQCPPNTICIETTTMVVLGALVILSFFLLRDSLPPLSNPPPTKPDVNPAPIPVYNPIPLDSYTRQPQDVLLNPYAPPLRLSVPDNSKYHQIGILKTQGGPTIVIPLMAKALNNKRDMWQYYTLHDRNTIVKLPVINKGKSCTDERGCDGLNTGDTVMVEGYDKPFIVTLYDSGAYSYNPDFH